MKKNTYILLLFLLHLLIGNITGFAQFYLNSSNFPLAGSEYNRFISVGAGVGNQGANQIYDFSKAMVWINDTIKYLNPLATGFSSFHPGASVATVQWGNVSIIWYYSSDANAYWTSGGTLMGDFGNGFTVVHANHPAPFVDTLISTDYSFGHTETEISGIRFSNLSPGVDYQTVSGKFIAVDGYGTLYAPLDTFLNVLRVKYIEYKFDTVFANNIPVDSKTDTLYYFKYFAPGKRHPVVIANTDANDQVKWLEIIHFPDTLYGCTDSTAENFNPLATQNNGSCLFCNQVNYTITPEKNICPGDSVSLVATGATKYLWSTGDSVSSIVVNPDSSQTYSVFLSNQSYCWQNAVVKVNVFDNVTAGFWGTPISGDSILFVNTSVNATNYFWDFGDSTSVNEKNPKHHFTSEGPKTVKLIASNQCFADTFFVIFNNVGTNELTVSGYKILVFPNPNNGRFKIQLPNLKIPTNEIRVFNSLGETIISSSSVIQNTDFEIDFSREPNGIFFIQIKTEIGVYQQKLVKM